MLLFQFQILVDQVLLRFHLMLNADFREGFIKNRYIGRTFIMPGQALRKKSVSDKN